jgi:biopolymer transport protein ExbD
MSAADSLRPVRKRRRADINIVPLIDVLVVLIFFFLVSMQFRNLTLLQLILPEMETAGDSQQKEYVEISITKEGIFYYNDEEVNLEQLGQRLEALAQLRKDMPILISADEASVLKDTTSVMDLCRKYELEGISLQTR